MAYLTCGNYSMTGLSCWDVLVYCIQENFCALYLWSCCALRQADNGISHLNVLFLVDISRRSAQGPVSNHFTKLNKMYVLLTVQPDIFVYRKTNLMHNLFLVYFINFYMFRAYLGPSSGVITICIQQLVLIIVFRWLSVVLVGLEQLLYTCGCTF
jgi:hypothetical protein